MEVEVVSLVDNQELIIQSIDTDLSFPNSMFFNGIAVALNDSSKCQDVKLGNMNR